MKKFFKIFLRIALVLFLIGAGLGIYAFLIEPNLLVVNQYEVRLKKWDRELDGLRIVMISDIHAGSNFIDEDKIRLVVQKTNEQNPDLVFLLGDFISQSAFYESELRMPAAKMADSLSGLRAKYGVYAVLGNHEYWYGNDRVKNELERVGYTVLDDHGILIKTDRGTFGLAGLRDVLSFGSRKDYADYTKGVLRDIDMDGHKIIAITHNPDVAMMITDNREGQYKVSDNLAILMTGHTHGGQVRFPYYGAPFVPSSFGYTRGYMVESGLDMFITSGIGTSNIPVRFGVPPEIAVVTIRSEQH